jgi:lipid II:glycine glycyltransferase (peptidoglycan interpeptide bridge formation enzyme)
MVDIRQTPKYANYLSSIGWVVERPAEINYFIKKVPFLGSVLKLQRPEEIRIQKIRDLAKKHRAFQIIVEPKTDLDAKYLVSIGFKLSKSPYLPTKTLQLDLTKSERQLFTGLKKDAKAAIRKIDNSGLKFQEAKSTEQFRNEWKKAIGLKRYVPPLEHLEALKKSFGNGYVMYHSSDSPIHDGTIFLLGVKLAYYWQAFTNKEGRKALIQYQIVWEGILWAKKNGAKIFDFEGIYDERFSNKSWLGFTHFKKSFGGVEIEYPGAFVKRRLPF